MVGTWKLQISDEAKKLMPASAEPTIVFDFKGDGKMTATIEGGGQKNSMEGTYTLVEKALTLTTTSENGKAPKSSTPVTVNLSDDMKSFEMPGMMGMGKLVKQ